MKTNSAGQKLRDDAPQFPSDGYRGEFFAKAGQNAIKGYVAFTGKPKVYRMAYLEGFPHIEVESYYGQGVVVSYLITGETNSWDWEHRDEAWDWANSRKQHVAMLR